MNLKDLLAKVKAVFDAPPPAAAPVAPADTTGNNVVYTLVDGTQIAINQAGDVPAPGDTVTVAGAPAPEGILTLQDGSTITCDATGTITLYTAGGAGPVSTDVPGADAAAKPAAPAMPMMPAKSAVAGCPGKTGYSEQDAAALVAAFDTATGSDLMNVLTTCVKALMQSEFGWQIMEQKRLADTNAAINAYQTSLQASSQKRDAFETAANKRVDILEQENTKLKETIKGMFEILEQVVALPTASPKTVTGGKKEEFKEKEKATEAKFSKMGAALKEVKEQAQA